MHSTRVFADKHCMSKPVYFSDVEQIVDAIVATVGHRIVLALPLGLGKANHVANALFQRAAKNPEIELRIMTALTLEKPQGSTELERRFLGPLVQRVFVDYPDLDYALARRNGTLPSNIEVSEFFMSPGSLTTNEHAQQNYISSNYTHAARDLIDNGVNVVGQLIAQKDIDGEKTFSLSCNPDLTIDLVQHMRQQEKAGGKVAIVGQINWQLPFMYGDAVVSPQTFDMVLDNSSCDFTLFGPPKTGVSSADYMVGLYASSLVRDGGTLQVGIGSLGDAVIYAMQLRHEKNDVYHQLLSQFNALDKFGDSITRLGGIEEFTQGLYGATEMLVDGFMHLLRSGILKRKVYADIHIQKLLNRGDIGDRISLHTLDALAAVGAIQTRLTAKDVAYLQRFGILRSELRYAAGVLYSQDGAAIAADLGDPDSRRHLQQSGLGTSLMGGHVAHGGFFVGPQSFYRFLRELDDEQRREIAMTSVLNINQLYGNEVLDGLQRTNARFINSCLMVTLSGAVVSDGLEDLRVVSGVGGQFNFVDMAHALPDGRSIIKVRSTRRSRGRLTSNIVWNYGHTTVPRHLRDLVVSEYGIAELRGKTDKEVIGALLNITDSRFQGELLSQAKKSGKLPRNYEIPETFCHNYPEHIEDKLAVHRTQNLFPRFPFGTDLTAEEVVLAGALKRLQEKSHSWGGCLKATVGALLARPRDDEIQPYLARLMLHNPTSMKERVLRRLVAGELSQDGTADV